MTAGAITQASRPIGKATTAQILTIFAREYCSLWSSPGGACTVGPLSTSLVTFCSSALIFVDPPSELVLPYIVFTPHFEPCKQPNPRGVPLS